MHKKIAQNKHVFIKRIDICTRNEVTLRYTEKIAHRLSINLKKRRYGWENQEFIG